MKREFTSVTAAALLGQLLFLGGCAKKEEAEAKPVVEVRTAQAVVEDVEQTITGPATVFAAAQAGVAARSAAPIKRLLVKKGDTVQAGKVDVKLKVLSRQGGREIGFDLNSAVAGVAARVGSNSLSQAGVTLTARGQATQFKQVAVSDYALNVTLQNQPALSVAGSANYDAGTGDADAQVKLQVAVARCLQAFPQSGISFSSGDVTLNARVTQKQKTQTVTGDLTLANLSGRSGQTVFQNFGTQIKLDVANSPEQIQINQIAGSFSQNGNSGGSLDVSGTYKPVQKSADLSV